MRDNGLLPGNKQGAQVCAQGGGCGGAGEVHVSAGPALEASRPRYREEYGVFDLWERDGFVAQGLVSSIQSKRKVLACPRWSPRSLGLGQLGAEGEHDCCFYTAKLKARCEHFEVAKQGGWGFSACLTAGVKERCVEPSPALIL